MPYYLTEFVRVADDGARRVLARYEMPDAMAAEIRLADMSDNMLIDELKRRWSSGGH